MDLTVSGNFGVQSFNLKTLYRKKGGLKCSWMPQEKQTLPIGLPPKLTVMCFATLLADRKCELKTMLFFKFKRKKKVLKAL